MLVPEPIGVKGLLVLLFEGYGDKFVTELAETTLDLYLF